MLLNLRFSMFRRFLLGILFILLLSMPAAGISLYSFPYPGLEKAADKLKGKEYKSALDAALEAPESGARDFIAGMSAFKLARWEEAAGMLGRAASSFPLLGDYSLYNQAQALHHLSRFADAQPPLQNLLKTYPNSPLYRSALLLLGDSLYEAQDYKGALGTYKQFIEKFPSGSDSLSASYRSAKCREQMGDLLGAALSLRSIWLAYPAAAIAEKAEEDLQRLARSEVTVPPYTPEELFKRGVTLYDLRKYDAALKTFTTIPKEVQTEDLAGRIALRSGQALLKARRYKEAERLLAGLDHRSLRRNVAEEALYWLGRALDHTGKDDEAVATYLQLVDQYPKSELADNALLDAALIRNAQKMHAEKAALLTRLLTAYPQSNQRQNALWALAWDSYQNKAFANAAVQFKGLTESNGIRDKALYWLGKSESAAGNAEAAKATYTALLNDYPYGFYAAMYRKEAKLPSPELPAVAQLHQERRVVPAAYERAQALIVFGLHDEAKSELRSLKKSKNSNTSVLADLYLEMNDYNGLYALFVGTPPSNGGKNSNSWNLFYPLAFNEHVSTYAAKNELPPSLVYSIIRAESSYLPTALSPVGAVGLMQLMPATASAVAKKGPLTRDTLVQPDLNISLGTQHLKDLLGMYGDNAVFAIAAYNAGAGNVNKWRKRFAGLQQDEFIESIPFGETRDYVKKVLAAAEIYQALYQLDGPKTPPMEAEKSTESATPEALTQLVPQP